MTYEEDKFPFVYADPRDENYELPGARMTYFYMHGEAEERTGYDCCNGNLEALRGCLRSGAFIAVLKFPSGDEELCIVSSKYSGDGHMSGLVALLSDIDAVKFVFRNHTSYPSMFEHEKEFLRLKYPEVREAIREKIRENLDKF